MGADGAGGRVGWMEERKGKDTAKVTLTVTRTFIPLFTFLVNRQTIQWVNTQDGRWMEGEIWSRGGERPDVNRGLDRERESSTICILKDSKRKEMLQGMEEWDLLFTSKCKTTSFVISLILKFLGNTLNGFLLRVKWENCHICPLSMKLENYGKQLTSVPKVTQPSTSPSKAH